MRSVNLSCLSSPSAGSLWVVFYFAANFILTLHNKYVLSSLEFNCPWALTSMHILLSGLGSYIIMGPSKKDSTEEQKSLSPLKLILFSLLYSLNIALSNISMIFVSLAFHQLARSATPAFTLLLERVFKTRKRSIQIYVAVLFVILGICLATGDEINQISFTNLGLFLTFLGVFLSSLKGSLTNVLMVGETKLEPLVLIYKISVPSALFCMLFGLLAGEATVLHGFFVKAYRNGSMNLSTIILLSNGLIAMVLNWTSFIANKNTSALTMTVAGNIKQALSILISLYIFRTNATILSLVGICVTLFGGAWYSYWSYVENNSKIYTMI